MALDRKAIGIGIHAFRDQKTIPIIHKDVGRKEWLDSVTKSTKQS